MNVKKIILLIFHLSIVSLAIEAQENCPSEEITKTTLNDFEISSFGLDDPESLDAPIAIDFEDRTDFSPDLKKLSEQKNIQVAVELLSLRDFEKSPLSSPDLVDLLTQDSKNLKIITSKAATIIPDSDPLYLEGLISNQKFMESAFKKSQYKRVDENNIKMERRLKIKMLNFEKRISLEVHHTKYHNLRERAESPDDLPPYLKIILQKEKPLFDKIGHPLSVIDIDFKTNDVIQRGKYLVFFFQNKNKDVFILTHQFIGAKKGYFTFLPSSLFRKISKYGINIIAPKLIGRAIEFRKEQGH